MRLLWKDILPAGGLWHIVRSDLRRRPSPYHDHDFHELFWVEAGRGVHRLNGQRYPLEPGQLWFIRPRDHHQPIGDDRLGLIIVNLAMNAGHVRAIQRRYRGQLAWPWAPSAPSMHRLNHAQMDRLGACADRLAEMDQRAIVLDGALLGLLELLELAASAGSGIATDQASKTRSGSEATIPSWLTRGLALFDGSDSMNMGPGEFARLAHRTPEHVNRTMQVVFGCDTTTRLNAHRMQRAGRLLRMSALPISDVAQACGFASLTHFYRCFNAHYQNTPRQYRLAVTRPISRRA